VSDFIVLLAAAASALEARPGSYRNRYKAVVRQSIVKAPQMSSVTEDDLRHLPGIVQKYLRTAGAVGKPKASSVRIVFSGEFKSGLNGPAMPFWSEQINNFHPVMRTFLMRATRYGLPMEGFHLFKDGRATMQIKMASVFQVVEASGPEMDQSETVTFFNDLCLFTPAALIDRDRIQWEEDGPLAVQATYTHLSKTIHARLQFNDAGEIMDFVSQDRFMSVDGKTYQNYPWSTPVRAYAEINGRRVPVEPRRFGTLQKAISPMAGSTLRISNTTLVFDGMPADWQ